MKKTAILAGVTACIFLCLGGRLLAQGQMPANVRVAVVNIGEVFAKYEKAKVYKAEMEVLLKPYKEQAEKLKKGFEAWQTNLQKATTAELKAQCQQGMVEHKRAMEDLDVQTQKQVGTKQQTQIIILYKDVADAVKLYCETNKIDLVLAYGEQLEGDVYTFANIRRKMEGMDMGTTHPLFFVPGMEISGGVVEILNQRFRTVSGTPASLKK